MKKIWLENYQTGVPEEIEPIKCKSLFQQFEYNCEKFKDLPAFENFGSQITYSQLHKLSISFANYLITELKVKPADKVAIMIPNTLQYPVALFGIIAANAIVVNVNPLYTPKELRHQLIDCGAKTILILDNFAHTLEEIIADTQIENTIITKVGDLLPAIKGSVINFGLKYIKGIYKKYSIKNKHKFINTIKNLNESLKTDCTLTQEDIAFLQYTGGTTGKAKAAILTHKNMLYNVAQATAWVKPTLTTAEEIIITPLPLYHIFSLTANCLTFMNYGALNILVTNPKDLKSFINLLKKTPFTAFTAVNTLFNALMNHPGFEKINFKNLKIALGGGMAVQNTVANQWQILTGKPILEAYGLTETSPAVCINPINVTQYNGTIGLPVPSTEISIRDENKEEVNVGESGDLHVKGPQVMKGYWNNEEETKEVLSEDGWLNTGDIAMMTPQGFIKIVDRKKDMILVSGFNVYPNEIEDTIVGMEGVIEAAVIGVCPDGFNEMVKAFVVVNNKDIEEKDIIDYCKQYLTAYKVPKLVEFRDELPKSNVGKVLRRMLKNETDDE